MNNNYLPPVTNTSHSHGYLNITPIRITFQSNMTATTTILIHFWGNNKPYGLLVGETETFNISCPIIKFREYLMDCKVTRIQIIDSRNRKPLAIAFLNWQSFLRPLTDKQIYSGSKNMKNLNSNETKQSYYLPFYDQTVESIFPMFNYNQSEAKNHKKIGQISIKWSSKVYVQNVQNIQSKFSSPQNSLIPQIKTNILPQQIVKPTLYNNSVRIGPQQISPVMAKDYLKDSINLGNSEAKNINFSVAQNRSNRIQNEKNINFIKKQPDYSKTNELDLQLIRVQLQMQSLVGATTKIHKTILQIVSFQNISKQFNNSEVSSLDIKNISSGKKVHWKVFPQLVQNNKTFFNSSFAIQNESSLQFLITFKKIKETLKGNISINCIGDKYDISLLSAQGIVAGYLKVKTQKRNTLSEQIEPQQIVLQQKPELNAINNKNNLVKKSNDFNANKQVILKKNQVKNQQQRQIEAVNIPKIEPTIKQSYFLVLMNKPTVSGKSLNYQIFNLQMGEQQNFIFVSQQQVLHQPLTLRLYQSNQQVFSKVLIPKLEYVPTFAHNMTCSLIFQQKISALNIKLQLYAGNLQQINYLIRHLHQFVEQPRKILTQMSQPQLHTQNSRKNTQNRQENYSQAQNKKLRTQQISREDKQKAELNLNQLKDALKDKYSLHEQGGTMRQGATVRQQSVNQGQDLYLVELLTKFLDTLSQDMLTQSVMNQNDFIKKFSLNNKNQLFQNQLIEVISAIFQQDPNQKIINIELLSHCFKAYKSFYQLYCQQRKQLFAKILMQQPRAVQRIKANCQMGTINQTVLWGRALSKLRNENLKQRINKLYKISGFGNTDPSSFLNDLQGIQVKQIRALDISNLGMLIKEFIQQYIMQASQQNILKFKQKLLRFGQQDTVMNIRNLWNIVEDSLNLKLSLWQSLMLIEQIKANYNCDLEYQQGIISAISLINWIQSIRTRLRTNTQNSQYNQSKSSFDADQIAIMKQINQRQDQHYPEVQRNIKSNKSASVQNNDSEIMDIANLLRQKDGYMQIQVNQKQKFNQFQQINFKKKLNTQQKGENFSQHDSIQSQNDQKYKNQKKNSPVRKKDQQIFYVLIRQIKFYQNNLPSILKATFQLNQPPLHAQSYFYYLTSHNGYNQACQKPFKYLIQSSLNSQDSSMIITFDDNKGQNVLKGILELQQLFDGSQQEINQQKKTLVLYNPRGKINGKLSFSITNKCPEKIQNSALNANRIKVNIQDMIPIQKITLYGKIDDSQSQKQEIQIGKTIDLIFKKPVYHSQLEITDQTEELSCVISLQQLYLKGHIQGQYPLVNLLTGTFSALLKISLLYQSDNQNNRQPILIKMDPQPKNQSLQAEFLPQNAVYLFTHLNSVAHKNQSSINVKLYVYTNRKQQTSRSNQKLILATPQISLPMTTTISKTTIDNQRVQIRQNQSTLIQFKLVQNGRIVAFSDLFQNANLPCSLNTYFMVLRSAQSNNLFGINFKKLSVKQQKYSLRKIYSVLTQLPQIVNDKHLDVFYRQIKTKHQMTMTEQQFIKKICQQNLSKSALPYCYIVGGENIIKANMNHLKQQQWSQESLSSTLIKEFMFLDLSINKILTGILTKTKIMNILSCVAEQHSSQSINNLQKIIDSIQTSGNDRVIQVPYLWICSLFLSEANHDIKVLQKKAVMSQIDALYQTLKSKYS